MKTSIGLVALTAALGLPSALAGQGRWYSDEQVTVGKDLYAKNCAACHGPSGEATENWREQDEEGRLPPPPLNGTAHTWHHSMDVLRRTVNTGGAPLGGSMPAFGGVLSGEQVDAIMAYVQSLWPEEIYATWVKANPDEAAAAVPAVDPSGVMTERLVQRLPPGTAVGKPEQTPLEGIFEVNAGGQFVYLDSTGRYALLGNLMDLETGENLTDAKRAVDRLAKVASFPGESKVVFTADGKERGHLDVFTDTTCPYCRKLHAEVAQLQAAGVTVRYLPFPRGGQGSQGDRELRAVWCAEDPVQGMHLAKTQREIPSNEGACDAASAVMAGYQLGLEVGIQGTPAIVLPDGTLIPGYRPHGELITALGLAR